MRVELTRVRVKEGKSARVDDWLNMLNDNMDEVIQTLDREQMKVEVIFRESIDGNESLYGFSVQGEAGEDVNTSPFEVDRKHIAFHEECIDHKDGAHNAQSQVVRVPTPIAHAIGWDNLFLDIIPFERREIIHRKPE